MRFALPILATLTLGGCASMSMTVPVIAVMHDDLFVGQSTGNFDGTGTIEVHSAVDPTVRCLGTSYRTNSQQGVVSIRCNDGVEGKLSFRSLTMTSGYGFGSTTKGPTSFTYGLTAEESSPYLTLPKGKQLQKTATGPRLVDA